MWRRNRIFGISIADGTESVEEVALREVIPNISKVSGVEFRGQLRTMLHPTMPFLMKSTPPLQSYLQR